MRQRRLHRAGKLPQAQVDLLTGQHGWVWDWHADWALFEDALRSFVAREGHARVGHAHVEAGYQLGQKAATLRGQYRRGQLDPQRVAMLEQLTGWTWAPRHGRSGTSVGRFRVSEGKGQLPAPRIADGHHT
jgi:hypothetical protein